MKYVKYHGKQVSSSGRHALGTYVKMGGYAKMALGFNTQFNLLSENIRAP